MNIVSNMIEAHVFRETEHGIEFLLLKRSESEIYPGLWQMVTGKIENNEKAYEAAMREIKEETSLTPERFWVVPNVNQFYSHEGNYISLMPVFAAKVGSNSVASICGEHCDSQWLSPDEAKQLLAWPGQRRSVDIITDYFTNKITFWNFTEIKLKT